MSADGAKYVGNVKVSKLSHLKAEQQQTHYVFECCHGFLFVGLLMGSVLHHRRYVPLLKWPCVRQYTSDKRTHSHRSNWRACSKNEKLSHPHSSSTLFAVLCMQHADADVLYPETRDPHQYFWGCHNVATSWAFVRTTVSSTITG